MHGTRGHMGLVYHPHLTGSFGYKQNKHHDHYQLESQLACDLLPKFSVLQSLCVGLNHQPKLELDRGQRGNLLDSLT